MDVNAKIKKARVLFDNHIIQIDGGVNVKTIEEPLRYGVNSFVMGTYLVNNIKDIYSKLVILSIKKDIENLPKDVNMEFEKRTLQIVDGGYAQNSKLLGINVPNIRKVVNVWYKYIDFNNLDEFLISDYHEYRRFAIYSLASMVKLYEKNIEKNILIEESVKNIIKINNFIENNIEYINNWDLTDEVAPNITAKYFKYCLSEDEIKEKLKDYITSDNLWKKRIGIVSMLPFAKCGDDKLVLWLIDKVIYEDYHLFQKASGWVLRELYKKNNEIVVNYLSVKNKQRKLPNILLSYACEKMSVEERNKVKLLS